jgi:hypothetical protein
MPGAWRLPHGRKGCGAGAGRGVERPAECERGGEAEREADATLRRRWNRTLAAYRRAEARVAAFKAEEALLPPARRAHPACEELEERFGALDERSLS